MPILLAGLAALAIAIAGLYALRWDPEVHFCKYAADVKRARAASLRQSYTNIAIFCGDSSCAFSIDGDRMLSKYGLPVANFGLSANMGPLFLTAFAVDSARPGDTLVVSFLPAMITGLAPPSDLAAKMGFALHRLDFVNAAHLTGERVHWMHDLLGLRPGAYYVSTYLCKVLLHKPLYRYKTGDVQPSGQYRTAERIEMRDDQDSDLAALTPEAASLLLTLKNWGEANHIRVVYSLPWFYTGDKSVNSRRRSHARLLLEIQKILPVLKDATLGAWPVRTDFGDYEAHLNEAGAVLRSDSVGEALKNGTFWSGAELERIISQPDLAETQNPGAGFSRLAKLICQSPRAKVPSASWAK